MFMFNMFISVKMGGRHPILDKKSRNNYLHKLKREGISVRQLERLTGITRGSIQKTSKVVVNNSVSWHRRFRVELSCWQDFHRPVENYKTRLLADKYRKVKG